jgi:Na+/phosphate symporter
MYEKLQQYPPTVTQKVEQYMTLLSEGKLSKEKIEELQSILDLGPSNSNLKDFLDNNIESILDQLKTQIEKING